MENKKPTSGRFKNKKIGNKHPFLPFYTYNGPKNPFYKIIKKPPNT